MKNKSKLMKIKQANRENPKVVSEWLYINEKEIAFKDLKNVFGKEDNVNVEIWEDAGICELELTEAKSIDLELGEVDAEDPFLTEHHAKTLFFVTIVPEFYEKDAVVMKKIVDSLGGFFCGNTAEFEPVIK